MGHIYNGIPLNHKKDKLMPFAATWVQLEILILSEGSRKEKGKYHMISLIRGIYHMAQMILSTKQKQIMDMKSILVTIGGGGREGDEWGVWGWSMQISTIRMNK